jgi:hypothetical protein
MKNHNYDNSVYFAADDAEKTVAYLEQKAKWWFDTLNQNRYIDKLKKSWQSYHGAYYEDGHAITFGGESGEMVNLAVNHYRNIASHILTMITSSRPAFQARAVNTDYKSQVQTMLANGLLDYYMREKRLEKYLKTAVEYSIVMGSGYIKMEWNSTSGEIYDYIDPDIDEVKSVDEDGKMYNQDGQELKPFPVYEGDVEFRNLSPFDVVFDSTKESFNDNDWVITRCYKNKFDLAEKFPELREKVLAIGSKTQQQKYRLSISPLDETSDIPVYEFFHRKTESMPQGRYILYLNSETVLMDTAMPYRRIPVYRISPGEILGTPYGYTPMFDLLPLQDATNSLYSTVLTNQNAFGVQNILNPRGNDIRATQLSGGLNFIEYNPMVSGGASGKPEAFNPTSTPAEIFNFIGTLERQMETISGINSVARGNPEKSLTAGNALALVQSQALQFVSGLQQSYIMLIEDVGTGLVQLLQDFAKVPRVAAIAGKTNKTEMKLFSSEDIDGINRIVVDVGNALATTTAGRIQMADNLIQMGILQTAEQYFSVINTGKLETLTEGITNELLLVRAENEKLTDGSIDVQALATDKHARHIDEHLNVLSDPELRQDAQLVERVMLHVMQHIELLQTTDPNLLALRGEQPLGPPAGSPVSPENVPQNPADMGAAGVSDTMMNPDAAGPAAQGPLPSPAQAPSDPNTGQPLQAMNRPLGQ